MGANGNGGGYPPGAKPAGFVWIQAACVAGFVILGVADLWTPETVVPWMVYAGLLGIGGGPELLKIWPGGK